MPNGLIKEENYKINSSSRNSLKSNMEDLIHHFKLYVEGFHTPKGESYIGVEAPKGEFGLYIISDGSTQPYRCKIRAPGFIHLQAIDYVGKNLLIADIVTVIGTLDIVFGEIDR
jgi:NADH:ubiquinone oxidoreductase subunit D